LELTERSNYVGFCLKNPSQWPSLFYYYGKRIIVKIRDKAYALSNIKHRFHHYPNDIYRSAQSISAPTQASESLFEDLPTTGWLPGNGPGIASWAIPLATYSFDVKDINWFRCERDKEDTFALHRFGWLLRWLSLHPAQEDLETANSVIFEWISQVSQNSHRVAWETYSASERVVNWLLYLCATRDYQHFDEEAVDTFEVTLLEHLHYISHHLEYYDKTCNNHILNNARALYIGGRILKLPEFSTLAKILFRRHLPELIDQEGVLREASSHYQLLLTRTMVEVWWTAHTTEDREFTAYLYPIVLSMLSSSLYMCAFSEKKFSDDFPRVGDVSPDYPVSWFPPRSEFNHEAESWWGLWDKKRLSLLAEAKGLKYFLADGLGEWKWFNTQPGSLRLFVYMPNSGKGVYPEGHGHMDFGSFLLYDGEGPIFTDRGRSSYNSDEEGRYGFSARAHNTTLVNGLPLVPECRGGWLAYRKCLDIDRNMFSCQQENKHRITFETGSVERLGNALKWRRDITLIKDHFEIIETLFNPQHIDLEIETNFHLAPGWVIDSNYHNHDKVKTVFLNKTGLRYCLIVERSNGCLMMDVYRGNTDEPTGWHSPEYGARIPAVTLRFLSRTSEPCVSRFVLCPI
jgi:hypothetical protein